MTRSFPAFVLLATLVSPVARAGDWTSWGGPTHDFRVKVKDISATWPEGGPKKLWSRPLGDGYSAIVTDGKTLYTMYSIRKEKEKGKFELDGQEVAVALDARTGKTLWEHKYDDKWYKGMAMEFGPGPHSTPLLVSGRLVTVGVMGQMFCFNAKTGKVIWSHNLTTEYELAKSEGGRGYGASPFFYKETIILPVGGKGKGVIAWNLEDGKEAWRGGDFDMTYATIFDINLGGQDQLIIFGPKDVMGMRPGTGEILWKHTHPTTFGANISTPVWDAKHNRLFISSAYGMGSRGLELDFKDGTTTPKELWFNKKVKIHFGNAVRIGETIFGSSGDMGPSMLCSVDMQTGELNWQQRGLAKSSLLAIGKKLLILTEDGNLVLADVSEGEYKELARAQVCSNNAWTVPTLVDHTLYIRDRKEIKALDLGGKAES